MILTTNNKSPYVILSALILFSFLFVFALHDCIAEETLNSSRPRKENFKEKQKEMQAKMQAQIQAEMQDKIRQETQLKMQAKMMLANKENISNSQSGFSAKMLAEQSDKPVKMPTIEAAAQIALDAAKKAAVPLIDRDFHKNGKTLVVPVDFETIQRAINAAESGDTIVVNPGIYYEKIMMKDGVKLVSLSTDQGEELVSVDGAMLKLPRRSIETIIDGYGQKQSSRGMVDFDPGLGDKTIVDGFTIRNLPPQDHHVPGHAHSLNVRGASPVITNCLIINNGSTGIGSHVVFNDQDSKMGGRDFRYSNIKHFASGILYNNIITQSLGLGIGCNHFSTPFILGNEIFANSDVELGGGIPSPGIGNKHGSAASIIGNLIHDNQGGGILTKVGAKQGRYPIDRLAYPAIISNVVFNNGQKRPAISSHGVGTEEKPVIITGNYVYNSGAAGISIRNEAVAIIENNMISKSNEPSIAINGSTALRLNYNQIVGEGEFPEILIINDGIVEELKGNAVDIKGFGPKFMVKKDGRGRIN